MTTRKMEDTFRSFTKVASPASKRALTTQGDDPAWHQPKGALPPPVRMSLAGPCANRTIGDKPEGVVWLSSRTKRLLA